MMDRDEAYRVSLQQIRSGDVSAACRTVADYELSQPQPRGLFSGASPQEYWARYPEPSDVEILESIFSETPEILGKISQQQVRFNVSWPQYLLDRVDEYTSENHETRSGFLAKAALTAMNQT